MSRLIDADELKIKLADELSDALGETDFTDGLQHGLKLAIGLAEETPLVDAKPIRHGHWIDNGKYWYVCSVCGYVEPLSDLMSAHYKYCPWCGAKMDEERRMTCDKCQYCYEQSNHNRNARIHTIRFICMMNRNHPSKEVIKAYGQAIQLVEEKTEGVNPDDTCELWEERKGKMKIRYKDGYVDEVKEDEIN